MSYSIIRLWRVYNEVSALKNSFVVQLEGTIPGTIITINIGGHCLTRDFLKLKERRMIELAGVSFLESGSAPVEICQKYIINCRLNSQKW